MGDGFHCDWKGRAHRLASEVPCKGRYRERTFVGEAIENSIYIRLEEFSKSVYVRVMWLRRSCWQGELEAGEYCLRQEL